MTWTRCDKLDNLMYANGEIWAVKIWVTDSVLCQSVLTFRAVLKSLLLPLIASKRKWAVLAGLNDCGALTWRRRDFVTRWTRWAQKWSVDAKTWCTQWGARNFEEWRRLFFSFDQRYDEWQRHYHRCCLWFRGCERGLWSYFQLGCSSCSPLL